MSKEMRQIKLQKAVINIGVGDAGERLLKAEKVLKMVTTKKPVRTVAKTTNRDLGIRKGMQIGCKVTLRGPEAEEFVKKAFWIRENRIATYSFDPEGNFSFGISDYTDFPGMKYDPEIGIFGLDVCVSLFRPGRRVASRRIMRRRVPKRHRITKKDGHDYVKSKFGVEVVD
nr:50S ribosomal protein L5P [uncultured archaeon]